MTCIFKYSIILLVPSVFVHSVILRTSDYYSFSKSTPELIADEGYPVETHWVTTADGYNLCLHRIPARRNKTNSRVAFLMHGLMSSSSCFVLFGPGESLGYILADEGYDVWMGNARGNIYSRNHTIYNPDNDTIFWDFSFHESGEYDLPTMIDYILNTTGVDGVYYVGYSQSTTSFFVMASEKPKYNQKIKVHIGLAPLAYMDNVKNQIVRALARHIRIVKYAFDLLNVNEFLPGTGFLHLLRVTVCKRLPELCQDSLISVCGYKVPEANLTNIPYVVGHFPDGSSVKQFYHYAQVLTSGKFRKYDYGFFGNLKQYGRLFPPNYDLRKITAPVALFYSNNDWFVTSEDVERLYAELEIPVGKLCIADDDFSHLDYVFGVNMSQLVYQHILNLFNKY